MVDKQKQLAAVNVKDALDPTLRDNLVRNITNELYTAFSTKISSDVVASVLQYQEMSISNQSYSVSMQHNVQSITVDILVEIFSKFYQKANYYNQAEIATKTTNLMQNDDLSSLRDSLNTIITTIEDLWNSAVGKIIIVAIGVMYLIVVSLTLFFVFIKKK
jgi:tetrahydromethanopterin S-methyltransferase subunit G